MITHNVTCFRPDTVVGAVLRHGREEAEKLAVALKRSQVTYGVLRRRIKEACEKFLLGRLERWKLPRRYMTLTVCPGTVCKS